MITRKTIFVKTNIEQKLKKINKWKKIATLDITKYEVNLLIKKEKLNDQDLKFIETITKEDKLYLQYSILREFIGFSEESTIYKLTDKLLKKLVSGDFHYLDFKSKNLDFDQCKNVIKILCDSQYAVIPVNDGAYVHTSGLTIDVDDIYLESEPVTHIVN